MNWTYASSLIPTGNGKSAITMNLAFKLAREGKLIIFNDIPDTEMRTGEPWTVFPSDAIMKLTEALTHPTKWLLTYNLNTTTEHDSFEEAFRELFKKIKEEETISLMMLEQGIWIKPPGNSFPMMFYKARDYAIKIGLLKDREIVEDYDEKVANRSDSDTGPSGESSGV